MAELKISKPSKKTNIEKHRNIKKWRTIEFFYEISEN